MSETPDSVNGRNMKATADCYERIKAQFRSTDDPVAFAVACAQFSGYVMQRLMVNANNDEQFEEGRDLTCQIAALLVETAGLNVSVASGDSARDSLDKLRAEINREHPGRG